MDGRLDVICPEAGEEGFVGRGERSEKNAAGGCFRAFPPVLATPRPCTPFNDEDITLTDTV